MREEVKEGIQKTLIKETNLSTQYKADPIA